jgi:5S rRNA maturation endonuclease (ribonuclease M5)
MTATKRIMIDQNCAVGIGTCDRRGSSLNKCMVGNLRNKTLRVRRQIAKVLSLQKHGRKDSRVEHITDSS